jgi:2-methylisocitrate lyase-like PEP mutase family enzyme
MEMQSSSETLRKLLAAKTFLHLPSVYDPLTARLVQQAGFEAAYVGGYVSGASSAKTEPLLTMTEQVDIASRAARSVEIPVLCDAGAGFGEPLHTMRTVREFIIGGIAGVHIEDQLFPKRAHYHKYQVHAIPTDEFVQKIRYACKARDEMDKNFVVIARTDVCREFGLDAAAERLNRCVDTGADMGLLFPRNPDEAERAPKVCELPLVYVMSRGNRDGRPIFSIQDLKDMGYAACIDAQVVLGASFWAIKNMLAELRATGQYTGLTNDEFITCRKAIEDIVGLEEYYEIEEATVENR